MLRRQHLNSLLSSATTRTEPSQPFITPFQGFRAAGILSRSGRDRDLTISRGNAPGPDQVTFWIHSGSNQPYHFPRKKHHIS